MLVRSRPGLFAVLAVTALTIAGCGRDLEDFDFGEALGDATAQNILIFASSTARNNNLTQGLKDRAVAAAEAAKAYACDEASEYRAIAEQAATRAEIRASSSQRIAEQTQDAYEKNTQLHAFARDSRDVANKLAELPQIKSDPSNTVAEFLESINQRMAAVHEVTPALVTLADNALAAVNGPLGQPQSWWNTDSAYTGDEIDLSSIPILPQDIVRQFHADAVDFSNRRNDAWGTEFEAPAVQQQYIGALPSWGPASQHELLKVGYAVSDATNPSALIGEALAKGDWSALGGSMAPVVNWFKIREQQSIMFAYRSAVETANLADENAKDAAAAEFALSAASQACGVPFELTQPLPNPTTNLTFEEIVTP